MFQSSPDPKAGRHLRYQTATGRQSEFQSSPDPKAGRHEILVQGVHHVAAVSILARPEGRAPRERFRLRDLHTPGFNPRPTRRPGTTRQTERKGPGSVQVSILARPEGRAPRSADGQIGHERVVSILARPEGRAPLAVTITGYCLSYCFNPRPTRRPGATIFPRSALPPQKRF